MRNSFKQDNSVSRSRLRKQRSVGFTLAEVVVSIGITGVIFGGILTGYIQSGKKAEWSGYSLAAQAYGIQQLEQARAAVWDISSATNVNQITNLNLINWTFSGNMWRGYSWTNIDIPYNTTNGTFIRATNFVSVTNVVISTTPLISVHAVRVDTVWRYQNKNVTNTLVNYYAPDQ